MKRTAQGQMSGSDRCVRYASGRPEPAEGRALEWILAEQSK